MKKIKNLSAQKKVSADTKGQPLVPYITKLDCNSQTPVLDEISDMLGFDAKKNPSVTFLKIFFHKEYFSKKEVQNATGLSERMYSIVVDEHYSTGLRKIRTNCNARQTLRRHLERKDLSVHQRLLSELFLKTMNSVYRAERLRVMNVHDNMLDEIIELENNLITVEELEEAMNYYIAHIIVTTPQKPKFVS